jgi:hypothetical protein
MITGLDEDFVEGMIVDCSTISIQYAVNGIATVSFVVYTEADTQPYSNNSGVFDFDIAGVHFQGYVNNMDLSPAVDSEYSEWKVTATAVGK